MTTRSAPTEPRPLSPRTARAERHLPTAGPYDQPVLSIRASISKADAAEFIADALHDVRAYMHEHHLQAAGPPFSICRTSGTKIDIEVGWPTTEPGGGTSRIHGGVLPRSLVGPETVRSVS